MKKKSPKLKEADVATGTSKNDFSFSMLVSGNKISPRKTGNHVEFVDEENERKQMSPSFPDYSSESPLQTKRSANSPYPLGGATRNSVVAEIGPKTLSNSVERQNRGVIL